jgi:two-component system sensor histidine kinase AlgZ
LHAISALLRVDPRAAEEMVADLAEILRASFSDATTQETSLESELDLVGCYLRIQQRRFGERLVLDWRIAPDTLRAAVPALVLQSLVENAVIHGIAPLARPGTLSLWTRREHDRLLLSVADDGAGVPAGHHVGVGLANVQERLVQLYGEAHSFAMRSDAEHGTRVDIAIPYRHLAADTAGGPPDEDTNADRRRRAAGAAEPVVAP